MIKLGKPLIFRIIFYLFALIVVGTIFFLGWQNYQRCEAAIAHEKVEISQADAWLKIAKNYGSLKKSISVSKQKYPEIDAKGEEEKVVELRQAIISGDMTKTLNVYQEIKVSIANKTANAEKVRAEESKKGDVAGTVLYSSKAVSGATIKIVKEGAEIATLQLADGAYTYRNFAGKYTIKVTASGYNDFEQEVEITAGQKTSFDIILKKPVSAASVPASITAQSTTASTLPVAETQAGFTYERKTVQSDRGSFTVHLMTFDLNAGIEMVVDTAADGDCATDCPVKSLKDYITSNGAFAGIHGTYFCPASYSDCQSEINSFYYKMYNRRLDKRINWSNGLGDYLPFLMISRSGTASYHNSWSDVRDSEMQSGISCRPNLVSGGQVVVTDGDLDSDKERYSKIDHGFIGLKDQTIYAGVVSGANILDSASVVHALGIDHALNIDGGGTTAMYANGSYKMGPGRAMPNAIVFRRK